MNSFADLFLDGAEAAEHAYLDAIGTAAAHVVGSAAVAKGPTSPLGYAELTAALTELTVCPDVGVGLEQAVAEARDLVLAHTTCVTHPDYAAHLHCPPLIPALAAEVMISAANQSMDSFDQGPSATVVECRVVDWLRDLVGFPSGDGVFTSGATQSNLMGLLLARDAYAQRAGGWSVARAGLPPEAGRWRVACAPTAHFSVAQSLSVLGLGDEAVLEVGCDAEGRMDPRLLRDRLASCVRLGDRPIALALTAGTTDLGSIDPIPRNAAVAREFGLWVHVDAAAGGALLLSDTHRDLLRGLDSVDSVAFDPHKLLFQPISCGVFLVRDAAVFELVRRHADYLNPPADESADGPPDLVRKSLQTTRRFDALKVLITMRALGRATVAALVDAVIEAASAAAARVGQEPELRLLAPQSTNTVALRWIGPPGTAPARAAAVNTRIQRALALEGRALIGRTGYGGAPGLKLTFANPLCTPDNARRLVADIAAQGREAAALPAQGETDHEEDPRTMCADESGRDTRRDETRRIAMPDVARSDGARRRIDPRSKGAT